MASRLVAIFLLFIFVAGHAFAGACVSCCKQTLKPNHSEFTTGCATTICAQDAVLEEITVTQVNEKDSVKEKLFCSEALLSDYLAHKRVVFLNYEKIPIPQKLRLHLRLRRLLI